MQLHISQHAYELLAHEAQARATTPEALVESLAEGLATGHVARNETEFYHALGFNDDEIAEVIVLASQLPELIPGPPLASQIFDED